MLLNSVATTRPGTGLVLAEAVDFDGANDYLSLSSDLTGNADGKTFTFSAWVSRLDVGNIYYVVGGGYFSFDANTFGFVWYNPSGAMILYGSVNSALPVSTIIHVMVSVDLSNSANRYVYINDVSQSVTWSNYVNDNINFTNTSHFVASSLKGRLAHVFLDYTYRDLSNSTNRRLFITSDRKPVNKSILTALNPILYLPMDDPSTAHVNAGTGGNFTLNGTIARSGRGPNQTNVPYSDLDGAADYLSRTTAPVGIADGKQFTSHFVMNGDTFRTGSDQLIWCVGTGGLIRQRVYLQSDGHLYLLLRNSSATTICQAQLTSSPLVVGRNYVVTISIDISNTANRFVYVNGVQQTPVWTTYTDSVIDWTLPDYLIGVSIGPTEYFNGRLGNVFFHTSYIDLSVAANLAKFVTGTGIDAKPVDMGANGELPLGVQPLIYLPMYGNNAGKNYGSGGDFTVNSGPYTGARGPNEYWGNKADFDGSTGYLARTSALTGVVNTKTASCSFTLITKTDVTTTQAVFYPTSSGTNTQNGFAIVIGIGTLIFYGGRADVPSQSFQLSIPISANTRYDVQACFDTQQPLVFIYVNGFRVLPSGVSPTDALLRHTATYIGIGAVPDGSFKSPTQISEFYFTTDYIDFSQEANRLKFRDAFGNPVDLNPQIQAGTLPNPAIYMRFDPADQGKNSGTGGDFTKYGTISDGGQL